MTEREYQKRISELERENAALKDGKTSITQIGVHIPRDIAGMPVPAKAVKIYALTTDLQAAEISPQPQDDGQAYVDVAGLLCQKQKAYVAAVKAAERENARRPAAIQPLTPAELVAAAGMPTERETPEDLSDAQLDEVAEKRALKRIRAALAGAGLPENA